MKIEDFVSYVEMPNVIQQVYDAGSHRSNPNLNVVDALFQALAQSNLLVTNIVLQSGGYNSLLGRQGIVMSKTEIDYEVDDEHYVFRAVFRLSNGVSTRNVDNIETREDAIARLLELSLSNITLPAQLEGIEAIEVTQYGRMNAGEPPVIPEPTTWPRNSYNISFTNVGERPVPPNYNTVKRGNRYSLFNQIEGLVGELKLRVLEDCTLKPLTEQDMTFARGFIKLENDYNGWIPDEIHNTEPVIKAEKFEAYRIADTDRSIRATTVLQKTKNRRTHFNCGTHLKHEDKRYTVPPGEYFFAPTSDIILMSMFDYDIWLALISKSISMTKSNSRVGFLSAASEYQDGKSINIKTKVIEGSADKNVDSTFTRRANSGRLK